MAFCYLRKEPPALVADILEGRYNNPTEEVEKASPDGMAHFPDGYREFMSETAKDMSRLATQALQLSLWRVGTRGGPLAVVVNPLYLRWSRNPVDGHKVALDESTITANGVDFETLASTSALWGRTSYRIPAFQSEK